MFETYYVHLEFQSKAGCWSINLPFLCSKCGVCCSLDDFLVAGEICGSPEVDVEVYAKFKVLTEELGELFDRGEGEYERYVVRARCPFLVGNLCSIYEIRPMGCRQFPNTFFGMLSVDCVALVRFRKQCFALKRGRVCKVSGHFTSDLVRLVNFSERQYASCIARLCRVGISAEELVVFNSLNGRV